jgi:hypothetical protein
MLAGPGGLFDQATFLAEARVGALGGAPEAAPKPDPQPDPKPDPKPEPKPKKAAKIDIIDAGTEQLHPDTLGATVARWLESLLKDVGLSKQFTVKMTGVASCQDMRLCLEKVAGKLEAAHREFAALRNPFVSSELAELVTKSIPLVLEFRTLARQAATPEWAARNASRNAKHVMPA